LLLAESYLKNRSKTYSFYGGYDDAQRKILCIYDENIYYEPYFPLTTISFSIIDEFEINHRDVLGALMSMGIKREYIGDIIFFGSYCVFFTVDKLADYFIENLTMVKRLSVKPFIYTDSIRYKHSYIELNVTLSSLRLDCVVSCVANVSRTVAEQLILSGMVTLNGSECLKKDKVIDISDVISVRKKGKFKIFESCGLSKKGKFKLKVLKYN
jgi:RNA-binding protein YlmH